MKMYFVCEVQGPQWIYCEGVLDNGFCFGSHLCSAPRFAPGDLYFNRKNRVDALREMFGIDPETVEAEMVVIRTKSDIPVWWDSLCDKQESLKPLYDRYKELVGDTKSEVKVEVS